MAKITGQYSIRRFEEDVDFNLWEKEDETDVWTFDGSILTSQENNVTELPNPSKWEYVGNNLKLDFVNGIPVISGGTITDIRSFRNEKLDGSGSWIPEFRLSNAQIDAVGFYNAFNNVDPTDNVILWKKMLSGDDTFILSDNPDGNYVRSYAGNDHITGSTGNDIFDGGTGNDTIIGGGGTDIAIFSGRFRDYKITKLTGNSFTVQDTRGIDGTDLLQDISTFRFSDVDKSFSDLSTAIDSSIITRTVTVKPKTTQHHYSGTGSGLGYYLDDIESPLLTLTPGKTYRFNQDDSSNASHQLRFYATADRATPYTANVTTVGTAGSPGAYTEISVTDATPVNLHYQCVNHAYMGNTIQLNPSPGNNAGSTNYSYSLSKLSGLSSSDTLIGTFENFQFFNLGGNRQGIQKKGTDLIDEITGISTLTFNDTRISVLDGIAAVFNQVTGKETRDAQMFRLYNASFNRFPDSAGLNYWINEYSNGITDYKDIAESFIISNEFKQRYGATNTNLEFATNMYKNILGRLPDAEGLNYWVSNLNAGINSRVDVLGGFSESVENKNFFSQVTGFA